MIVVLLSYTQWCVGQGDTYSPHILLDNVIVENGYEIVFGEEFTKKYYVSLHNDDLGSYVEDLSKLTVELKKMDGDKSVLPGRYKLYGNSKIPVGKYYIILKYAGNQVLGFDSFYNEKTLTVLPRPLEIHPPSAVNLYCMYNGGTQFTMADFVEMSSEEINSKDYFVNNCTMGSVDYPLPEFDQTTKIDFDYTTFTFGSPYVSADAQSVVIDWKIKSTDANEDWTSNYDVQTPIDWLGYILPKEITATIEISDKKYDGNAKINNSQLGNITLSGVIDGDDVTAKAKQGEYLYLSAEIGKYDISIPVELYGSQKDNYTCTFAIGSSSIVKEKCPYDIVWKKGDEIVSDNVSLTYGAAVGVDDIAKQKFYDLVPLMYDNNGILVDAIADLNFSVNNGLSFDNQYIDGGKINVRQGGYVFKANFSQYDGCESKIGVDIKPLKVSPEPSIIRTKVYDGTNVVFSNDADNEIEIKLDDIVRVHYTATYDTPDAGTDKKITIEFDPLGCNNPENYELSQQKIEYTDGVITAIKPGIIWNYKAAMCPDQSRHTIAYGDDVKNVTASLVFDTPEQDAMYQTLYKFVYKLYKAGNQIDENSLLEPGDDYEWKVVASEENGNPNLLDAVSSIAIKVDKIQIELQWSGTNKNQLEYENAKVNDGLSFAAINALSQSKISYQYYISSDLDITEDGLFVEGNKKEVGFAPEVGKYMFGCIATDDNGFMTECKIMEDIEIKKSSVMLPITLPVIKTQKTYDGNYFAFVESPAMFGDTEFETTAYYVDNTHNEQFAEFTESDFRKDASRFYSIYYKFTIPEEVSSKYNLYLDAYLDDNSELQYVVYDGGYVYSQPGSITCGKLSVDVSFPNEQHEVVYGDFVFGGSNREKDILVSAQLDGVDVYDVKGEWGFADWTVTPLKDYNESIEVGHYENIQATYNVPEEEGSNYCGLFFSDKFSITVLPRPLTFEGELHIADKFEDGTDVIERSSVTVPTVEGILPTDEDFVKVKWDYSNTKYPSAKVKYDDTQTEVVAYENIPVGVSLDGSRKRNYTLPSDVLLASSKIKPFDYEFTFNIDPEPEGTDVYRRKYGESVLGKDLKLTKVVVNNEELDMTGKYVRYLLSGKYDRTFMMQYPNASPDDYYDIDVQVIKGDREHDKEDETFDIVCQQKIKFYVYKYKLEISTPDIITDKVYDGKTTVKWVNGNNCVITNAVDGDDVKIVGEPEMAYDTPDVGFDKKITVKFTVDGRHLDRYLLPDDYETVGVIRPENIVVADTPEKPGVLATNGCERVELKVNVSEGYPTMFSIVFDDKAHQAGFADIIDSDKIKPTSDGEYVIQFDRPKDATYGNYTAMLHLKDPLGAESNDVKFDFSLNLSSQYLHSWYEDVYDVILVDNRRNEFSGYQWFRFEDGKDSEIVGENKQFYNELSTGKGLDGWYGAYVWTLDGNEKMRICPRDFTRQVSLSKSSVEKSVSVYPNPAASLEPVTVRLNGFDEDDYKWTVVYVYNSMGSIVSTLKNVGELNTVCLPAGNYSGVVVCDGKKLSFKFIVRN